MKEKLKFVFFGTPSIASETLDILASNGYIPSIIITSPDKPVGRGLHLTPSPVSIWAENHNIPCLKPEKLNEKFITDLSSGKPRGSTFVDLYVVVAYGKILPETLINTPKLGTINIHYSLLPKYRGASPLEATLLNGDKTTGVSIQQMVFKLDSGPIIAKKEIKIDIDETKKEIKEKLISEGAKLLVEYLPKISEGNLQLTYQNEDDATFCKKIKKEDGEIDINSDPIKNYNKYRAFYGWPGIYFFKIKNNKKIRVKITKAKYENGEFIIEKVIPEGKKEIGYSEFLKQN